MFSFLSKLFDSNEKAITQLTPVLRQVNDLGEEYKRLKDKQIHTQTHKWKTQIASGEKTINDIMPAAFALVREAADRAIQMRHYDVQILAAAALAMGKIAEQRTGEGKTFSAVPALYLHALTGRSVHLVTVNDYLARRDAGWMAPVFHMLGMTTAAIIAEKSYLYDPQYTEVDAKDYRLLHLKPVSRNEAYEADIVYGINSEFGFDYLRDNMAQDPSRLVQRGHYFAIVDEVDSVLIDEARTPHIISAPDEVPTEKYYEYSKVVQRLTPEIDFKVDEKLRTVHLTDHGIGKIEKMYGIVDIYEKDFDTVYHLEAALKARTLFHKEKDYIVRDNEVILVDEFTGRLMIGRRLSEGIHQAIEAKENVTVQRESKTLATVSLQNYFRMYEVLAGMTGTAATEAEEFHKIYKLDVVSIPTYRPTKREDVSDVIYKTQSVKLTAVVAAIEEAHRIGQPVLIGTTSIEKNEIVSSLLKKRGIPHNVLNAKNHEKEAEIIAQAGKKGAVTVATNMAGRGVDIILGGEIPNEQVGSTEKDKKTITSWQKEHDEVVRIGGLFIIGTERHESRRIDNQLRGRAGRQGDPGKSQFFVSLDDDIMRLFGGDTIAKMMDRLQMPDNMPLSHPLVTRAIAQAQIKVEGFHFDTRKHLVNYDDVLNKQREIIYKRRRAVLMASGDELETMREETLTKLISSVRQTVTLSDPKEIIGAFATIVPFDDASKEQLEKQIAQYTSPEEQMSFLETLVTDLYAKREESVTPALMRQIERFVHLSVIDKFWMDHLDAMDNLRQGIGLRGYGQRDPLVEYKNEGYRMFESLLSAIDDEISHRILKIQVAQQPPVDVQTISTTDTIKKSKPKKTAPTLTQAVSSITDASGPKKLGRNDPCWCGSGKKWKKCHYPS